MRRPKFSRWIKKQLLTDSGLTTFDLARLAALAQTDQPRLAEPLLLWALSNNALDRLMPLVWRDPLQRKYDRVIKLLEDQDIEAFALQADQLALLPNLYQKVLRDFSDAYWGRGPRQREALQCWEAIHTLQLELGIRNARIYQDLKLNPGNTNRYLKYGEIDKLSLEKAQLIEAYLHEAKRAAKAEALQKLPPLHYS